MGQRTEYGLPRTATRERHGIDSLVLGICLAMFVLASCALLNDHLRAEPGVTVVEDTEIVESLEAGEALWDLARFYAPTQDPRRWIEAVKQLNGWSEVPILQPGQRFRVVSWRSWPMNIETRERADGSVELVPIDPYAGDVRP